MSMVVTYLPKGCAHLTSRMATTPRKSRRVDGCCHTQCSWLGPRKMAIARQAPQIFPPEATDRRPVGGHGSPMEQPQSTAKVGPDPPWGGGGTLDRGGAPLGGASTAYHRWSVDARVKRPPCWRM